jgi:hypothetical protein
MKYLSGVLAFVLILIANPNFVLGGTCSENFSRYPAADPVYTDADWDIFNSDLHLKKTRMESQLYLAGKIAKLTSGDNLFAFTHETDKGFIYEVQKFDPCFRPLWSEPVLIDSSSWGNRISVAEIGDDTFVVWISGTAVNFGSSGSDLRWKAILSSNAQNQDTPEIHSVSLVWGATIPYLSTDLVLNQSVFHSDDSFDLELHLYSSGDVTGDVFVILDVYGMYWFWPDWTNDVSYKTMTPAAGLSVEPILQFTWPQVEGSASGLRFWTAALQSGTVNLISDVDKVEFGYE